MRQDASLVASLQEATVRLARFCTLLHCRLLHHHKLARVQRIVERSRRCEREAVEDDDRKLATMGPRQLPQLLLRADPLLGSVGQLHQHHLQHLPVIYPQQ